MITLRLTCIFVALLVLAGCDSPSRSVEQARRRLADYQAAPGSATQAAVEAALNRLDQLADKMDKNGDAAGAEALRRQANSIRTDYQAARMARALNDARDAIQGIGNALRNAGRSFSESIKVATPSTNAP